MGEISSWFHVDHLIGLLKPIEGVDDVVGEIPPWESADEKLNEQLRPSLMTNGESEVDEEEEERESITFSGDGGKKAKAHFLMSPG